MTIWQVIILVCLYLLVGGVISNVMLRNHDEFNDIHEIITGIWPIVICAIAIVWVLLVFGDIGKILVDAVETIIKSLRTAFNKEK